MLFTTACLVLASFSSTGWNRECSLFHIKHEISAERHTCFGFILKLDPPFLQVTNLMEHFKLSTSRDFRINGATLEAALHETEEGGEEEEEKEQTAEVLK